RGIDHQLARSRRLRAGTLGRFAHAVEEHARPMVAAGRGPLADADLPRWALAATLNDPAAGPKVEHGERAGGAGWSPFQLKGAFDQSGELLVGEIVERRAPLAQLGSSWRPARRRGRESGGGGGARRRSGFRRSSSSSSPITLGSLSAMAA